jgi:hypothetical protein
MLNAILMDCKYWGAMARPTKIILTMTDCAHKRFANWAKLAACDSLYQI